MDGALRTSRLPAEEPCGLLRCANDDHLFRARRNPLRGLLGEDAEVRLRVSGLPDEEGLLKRQLGMRGHGVSAKPACIGKFLHAASGSPLPFRLLPPHAGDLRAGEKTHFERESGDHFLVAVVQREEPSGKAGRAIVRAVDEGRGGTVRGRGLPG